MIDYKYVYHRRIFYRRAILRAEDEGYFVIDAQFTPEHFVF